MDNKFINNNVQPTDLLTILLKLKSNINKELSVATCAKVVIPTTDGAYVEPYPILEGTTKYRIQVKKLEGITLSENDDVLVIFTDLDNSKEKVSKNSDYHSNKYGIIVGKIA